jgi:hypothetical protein
MAFRLRGRNATLVRPAKKPPVLDTLLGWARDRSAPGAGDGYEIGADDINELMGQLRELLTALGGDASGEAGNELAAAMTARLGAKADLVSGKVPASQLPSYVDDVVEVADFASLPGTGEAGKLYITLATGFQYRWTGSAYAEIANAHAARTDNPHGVTKAQVGLGNVDNTADLSKPVSTAQAAHVAANAELGTYTPSGSNIASRTIRDGLRGMVSPGDYVTQNDAVIAARNASALLRTPRSTIHKLVSNPTTGDDLREMAEWIAGTHYIEETGERYLEIADGLHDVSTFVDITEGRRLDLRGRTTPTLIQITGISYSNDGEVGAPAGEVYTATVTVATALPDRVVVGYAIGMQNIQGDGGADGLNGAVIVTSIAGDRLSFTGKIRSHGVALTNPTTLDANVTLGLTPNRAVIPWACLRVNEAGWDGAAREGFMNALRGSVIDLRHIGISYNGIAGDNDILFAGPGATVRLRDYVVIAGAGEMVLRTAGGRIEAFRSCLGGSTMGVNIVQAVDDGTVSLTRCSLGSVSGDMLSLTAGSRCWVSQSVLTGANQIARTTYPSSAIEIATSRLSRALNGGVPLAGDILIDSASSVRHCTSPMLLSGGVLWGNPTISDCTNAAPTAYEINVNGSVWCPGQARTVDPTIQDRVVRVHDVTLQASSGQIEATWAAGLYSKIFVHLLDLTGSAAADIVVTLRTASGAVVTLTLRDWDGSAATTFAAATAVTAEVDFIVGLTGATRRSVGSVRGLHQSSYASAPVLPRASGADASPIVAARVARSTGTIAADTRMIVFGVRA